MRASRQAVKLGHVLLEEVKDEMLSIKDCVVEIINNKLTLTTERERLVIFTVFSTSELAKIIHEQNGANQLTKTCPGMTV